MKVRNLKANHNEKVTRVALDLSVKVRNLKANHNENLAQKNSVNAVLASVKVRNLKANHNRSRNDDGKDRLY